MILHSSPKADLSRYPNLVSAFDYVCNITRITTINVLDYELQVISANSKQQCDELRKAILVSRHCVSLSTQKFREPLFPAEKFAKSFSSSQKLGEALLASEEFGESAAAST